MEANNEMSEAERRDIERARPVVWDVLRADLESQGRAEDILYLEHRHRAEPQSVASDAQFTRVRFNFYERLSDYTAAYNATTGERISWYFDALRKPAGREIDREEALRVATEVARPPAEAVLEMADYEEVAGEPLLAVRWRHVHDGIPVERDLIEVLINGATGRAFSLFRFWHEIDERPTLR